ncbi:hypothetical protein QG37_05303 [Candidozyma auris]|uniref:Uncharacterized protein n=1 Tax=Candidozyma auris TaxID=498019 RepID=A0A0L0NV13_CANAR|nr:hypothetical protein QG37_05303 [[Candida] auris]
MPETSTIGLFSGKSSDMRSIGFALINRAAHQGTEPQRAQETGTMVGMEDKWMQLGM